MVTGREGMETEREGGGNWDKRGWKLGKKKGWELREKGWELG